MDAFIEHELADATIRYQYLDQNDNPIEGYGVTNSTGYEMFVLPEGVEVKFHVEKFGYKSKTESSVISGEDMFVPILLEIESPGCSSVVLNDCGVIADHDKAICDVIRQTQSSAQACQEACSQLASLDCQSWAFDQTDNVIIYVIISRYFFLQFLRGTVPLVRHGQPNFY